jgi:ABC-2 type transport system permease protein
MTIVAAKGEPGRGRASALRIIGAIALKDMLEAFQNHAILGILLGATMLMLMGLGLPRLLAGRAAPVAVLYDPAESGLAQAWAAAADLQAVGVESQAELERFVAEASRPILGLALPVDFSAAASHAGPLTVDGYVAQWATPTQVAGLVDFFEARLTEAAGQTVYITVAGHTVYPTAQAGGQTAMVAMHLAMELLIVGVAVVPFLFVEEKAAHTFDALLVSPASYAQVVAGKALAGSAYCVLGGTVVFAFAARWIVHWDLALLAILLGTAFTVGVGLLGGALGDNPQTLGPVMSVLVLFLLVPALLGLRSVSGLPAWAQSVLPYFPTTALTNLIRASLAGEVSAASITLQVTVLAASTAGVFALLIWRVRQAGR